MPDDARSLRLPTTGEADLAAANARNKFRRVLGAWACDLLALRKAGRDRPAWAPAEGDGSRQRSQQAA